MSKNYVEFHSHDFYSNLNMVECIDSPKAYMKRAKELGMKAIAISNHGNVMGWCNRYLQAKEHGLKYIHAVELYATETLDEKVKDNWHVLMFAKNYEGFKELNKLCSIASTKDNHYYYNPRISIDELFATSDNIYVSSACLGGLLRKSYYNSKDAFDRILNWFIKNKHRTFFEVQPHFDEEQIEWNKLLKEWSKLYDVPLMACSDIHAVSRESDETRMILKKAKKIAFDGEDAFQLYLKTYDELFEAFKKQGIWENSEIEEFIERTNIVADTIEEFEINTEIKYPKLEENGLEKLKKLIAEGIKFRGINELSLEQRIAYAERIKYELETIKKLDCADYLLLEDNVKSFARSKGIKYGIARGSASGSLITYLLQITNIDPMKENLSFGRFLNPERVGIADIDTDYGGIDRPVIFDYLLNNPKLNCAHIIAFGTLQLKGAIRDIARGLEISLSEVDEITKNIEENEGFYRDKYPLLFKHVDRVIGCIISMSVHPCGIIVADRDLDSEIGTFYLIDKETKQPVRTTAIDMMEIEYQQWTKLDVLSLDSIEVIDNTCKMANIDFESVMPDKIDTRDEAVWESIKENSVGIFQFEGDFALQIYKDLFSKTTILRIREKNPDFSYTDLFSLANAILRPSGASYRDKVVNGEFTDNGHEVINDFLKETLGVLAYQEQQSAFLVKFCGYTEGQADLVRKGIAKKRPKILEVEVPKIKETLLKSLIETYGIEETEAEKVRDSVIQVFMDAVNYSFSRNHAVPYSYCGYACAWLRYYYPLEFITASLNVNIGKEEKTARLIEYAKSRGIEIKPIKFGYSKSAYMFDKETNSIYQGIEPIKFLNDAVGEGLYTLRNNKYNYFTDLLVDIFDGKNVSIEHLGLDGKVLSFLKEDFDDTFIKDITKAEKDKLVVITDFETPTSVNSKQMKILIKLNFFSEFGNNKKLLNIYEMFEKKYKTSHKFKTKFQRYNDILEFESYQDNAKLSLVEQCESELEFLGHIETKDETIATNILMITEMNVGKTYTRAIAYNFNRGINFVFKVGKNTYKNVPFKERDVIELIDAEQKPKTVKINGSWGKSPTEKDLWVKQLRFIRKSK